MTSFVIVIFMTMGAVSAAEPGRSWTNTNHPGGLPGTYDLPDQTHAFHVDAACC